MFSDNYLLATHVAVFFTFHLLPEFEVSSVSLTADLVRCLFDSFSKSKSMANITIRILSTDCNNFFEILFILTCSIQLNKYVFERFLINSRENSKFKNISITLCILALSAKIIPVELLKNSKTILAMALISFMGSCMDIRHAPKINLRSNKQGQIKLRSNAKT